MFQECLLSQESKQLILNGSIATSRLIFSSAEMFKKPLANSVDPDQTAPSGSTLFASIIDLSVMLGNYLQHTTSADIFKCIFFLAL